MRVFTSIVFSFLLQLSAQAQVGNVAPDFTVTDTHGKTHRLYDYLEAGKTVVLDFFFTTCIPCQYYSPQVNLAYEKYGCNEAEVFFMAIDYNDNDARVLAYDQQYQIRYPSASGLNGGGNGVVTLYDIFSFPTFFVIDSTKTIIERIDPPTLQVFDYRFQQLGIQPAACSTSGITDENTAGQLEIFPNPCPKGAILRVRLPYPIQGTIQYSMINLLGKTVLTGTSEVREQHEVTISTEGLPAGLYFINVQTEKVNVTAFGMLSLQ